MAFHVWQKVVCVDDSAHPTYGRPPIRNGRIYTIRAFSEGYEPPDHVFAGLHFVEINSGHSRPYGMGERGFHPRRFRPVVECKTDIGIFQKMLIPKNQKEPV